MSSDNPIKPLSTSELAGPAQGFAAYCDAEKERRRNSGEDFDEELFDAAVSLTLRRLSALEEEGGA